MGSVLGWIASAFAAKKAADSIKPDIPKVDTSTPATPAASITPQNPQSPDTGVDTTGEQLKRKAKGKKGLMIQPANTGGSTGIGGTGLNL